MLLACFFLCKFVVWMGFMETETAWVEKYSLLLELSGVSSPPPPPPPVLSYLCFYDPLTPTGIQTGRCIEYKGKQKTCEVSAWCPVEAVEKAPE